MYIIVSLPQRCGKHEVDTEFCGLTHGEMFTSNLNYAMRFETDEQAKIHLAELKTRKKLIVTCVLWEII